MYRKLTTVAAVAALTLGLAACGGGGSDQISNVVDEEPTMDDSTMDDSTTDDSTTDDMDDSMKDDDMDTVMSDEEVTGRALGVATALTGDTTTVTNTPAARITRGESGAASIAVTGWTASAAASAGAEGWSGMMFDGAGLLNKGQSVAVYSNIEAAKRKAFFGANGLYPAGVAGGVTQDGSNVTVRVPGDRSLPAVFHW
jgi:hypothetical protein